MKEPDPPAVFTMRPPTRLRLRSPIQPQCDAEIRLESLHPTQRLECLVATSPDGAVAVLELKMPTSDRVQALSDLERQAQAVESG